MKTLDKLQIKPDKIIKNNDLLTLKGGYGDPCWCVCIPGGYLLSPYGDCGYDCYWTFGSSGSCTN